MASMLNNATMKLLFISISRQRTKFLQMNCLWLLTNFCQFDLFTVLSVFADDSQACRLLLPAGWRPALRPFLGASCRARWICTVANYHAGHAMVENQQTTESYSVLGGKSWATTDSKSLPMECIDNISNYPIQTLCRNVDLPQTWHTF